MSQYIPGIVQYVPQVQPYRPDLNFYQKVLETKQAQYKAGYDQLSYLYGNLLDSPMLRSENVDLRNKFFNQISADIAKVSSMDLSLPQNVEAAGKIFQPLTDNKYILKDMAYTKQAYGQLRQADNFRNCTNEKECGGKYWEGGVRAIQYQMQDFSKSAAEESLGFSAPRYTPAVNVAEKAMKFAKDMGFNMQTVSWTPDGRYQVTTKNGTQMIPSLTNAFIATFQNDQAAVDYYNTKSYLSRKDFIASSVDQYGSEEAAENFYLDKMAKDLYVTSENLKKSSEKDEELAQRNQAVTGQVIKGRGIDPNDPDDQKLAVSHNQSMVDRMIAASAADHYKQTADVVNPETVNIIDAQAKRRRVDAAVANGLFQGDLMNAAKTYAELTMEQDIKADPYALANHDHALALDRMGKQFQLDVEMENIRTSNDLLIKSFEDGNPLGVSTNSGANAYSPDATGKGGTATEGDLKAIDQSAFNSTSDNMSSELVSYMNETNNKLNTIATMQAGQYYGTVQVTQDMINWAKDKQKELFGQESTQTVSTTNDIKTLKGKDWGDLLNIAANGIMGIMGEAYESFVGLETKQITKEEQKNAGGYLDANGNLVDPRKSTSFSDSNSQNSWYNVSQRLNGFVENDPTARALFGQDPGLLGKKQAANDAQKIYFANQEKMKYNNNGTHKALQSAGGLQTIVDDVENKDYAMQQLNNAVVNGQIKNKDQFVKEYAANAPTQKTPVKDALLTMLPFGFLAADTYASNEAEAAALYDKYAEAFSKVYNQSEDAVIQFKDYKPIAAGYNRNASGAGIEASPISIRGVDSAFRGDLGAKDFVDIYRNARSVASKNPDKVQIYNMDGSVLGEDLLGEGAAWDAANTRALDLIYSHIQGGKKKTDKDRARFDMTIHPIIGNDPNKVGFTIKLDEEFSGKNAGSGKTPGATAGADAFTIVMDKDDVTADAYQRLNKGSYSTLMEAYGQVNLNEFSKYGGQMNITPNPNGQGYLTRGTMKFFDPESGTFKEMVYDQVSNPYATPDMLAQSLNADLQRLYAENMQVAEYLRQANPNLIKDPAQIVQQ
jgi:hypothetical protein